MTLTVSNLGRHYISKYAELEPLCVFANVVIDTIPTREDSQYEVDR